MLHQHCGKKYDDQYSGRFLGFAVSDRVHTITDPQRLWTVKAICATAGWPIMIETQSETPPPASSCTTTHMPAANTYQRIASPQELRLIDCDYTHYIRAKAKRLGLDTSDPQFAIASI